MYLPAFVFDGHLHLCHDCVQAARNVAKCPISRWSHGFVPQSIVSLTTLIFCFPWLSILTVAGWVLAAIAILQIPIWALHSISKQPGRTWNERMRMSLTPAQDWGPKDPTKRQQWLEYTSKRPKRFAKELWSMKIFRPKGRIESPETTH